jgi:Holliday junction DNA helicase RuvA
MIVGLEGIIEKRELNGAVIKVGPVSLYVFIPGSTLSRIGSTGDRVRLHTHLVLKEDNVSIYGFSTIEELGLFKNIISVSGVGPKGALAMLSAFSTEQLASAIAGGNIDLLSQVPGIGKKIAGRIVLELKGKLEKEWGTIMTTPLAQEDSDVIAALTSLGYSLKEATQAVTSLTDTEGLDLEKRVTLALQSLAKL